MRHDDYTAGPDGHHELQSDDTYFSARQVRQRYGGISGMTLWRWCQDARLGFPKPMVIKGRRFWRWSNLKVWEEQQ
jgi:predicted DNA-binding transcriptional regulator AlpA